VTIALALLPACFLAVLRQAEAITWDGDAGNGLWSDPLNWSGDVLPTSTSEVVIEVAGAVVHLDVDFTFTNGGMPRSWL